MHHTFVRSSLLRRTVLVVAGLASALAVHRAQAQSAAADSMPQPAVEADGWRFNLGLGVVNRPKYLGSRETRTHALPLFSAGYGRLFIGALPDAGLPLGIGYTLVQDGPWRAGLGIGHDLQKPRKASDSARLAGMGDIDATTSGSVFASYDAGPFVTRGSVVGNIGGHGHGMRANLDLEARYSLLPNLMLSAGPGITWADRKYTQTYFGVTAAQSAASILPVYETSSGLQEIRFGLGANYRFVPNWGLGARVSVSSLRGDAAGSPVTEQKTQTRFGIFANYRF